MKGSTLLKVVSIIMIVFAVIGIVVSVIGLIGVSALVALSDGTLSSGPLYLALIVALVACIFSIVAGIKGISNCTKPENAGGLVTIGYILVALQVISVVLTLIGGNKINFVSVLLGFALPVLYLVGAMQLKSNSPAA